MPAKKTKTKPKPKPKSNEEERIIDVFLKSGLTLDQLANISKKTETEKKEEVIDGEIIEEKPVGTKIIKVIPDTDKLMNLAKILSMSGMFPNIHNEYEAAAVIEYGRAIGIHHIIALQTIAPVKGRLCVESKVLYALALDKGIKIKIARKDAKGCTLEFSSPGRDPITTSFTEEDSKRAGLNTKPGFMQYPEEMHFNRCISKGLRAFDPRVLLGLSTTEEAEDFEESPLAKAPAEEKSKEPEEEKKPQVTFTKSKEQPASEPEKEEKPPEPPRPPEETEARDKEMVVEDIKTYLKDGGVDSKLFKKWLGEELQPSNPNREFVGLKFGNWSLTEGKLYDLKLLKMDMERAVEKYIKSETFKAEAQKEEPDEEEEEVPF